MTAYFVPLMKILTADAVQKACIAHAVPTVMQTNAEDMTRLQFAISNVNKPKKEILAEQFRDNRNKVCYDHEPVSVMPDVELDIGPMAVFKRTVTKIMTLAPTYSFAANAEHVAEKPVIELVPEKIVPQEPRKILYLADYRNHAA